MKDKILMQNMAFFGYHGVLEEENRLGQKFFVDAELFLDISKAGATDDMNLSVSYAEVYDVIKVIVEGQQYNLLETLAEEIAKQVLAEFPRLDGMMVRVRKPEAPVAGIFDYFGVEITRYA